MTAIDDASHAARVTAPLADAARRRVVKARAFIQRWWYGRVARQLGLTGLVWRTGNFSSVRWLGHPIWQNPLDAWALQEAIVSDDVDLVVECGTNRGGSALYMASIFDLLGRGNVITIDIEALSEVK